MALSLMFWRKRKPGIGIASQPEELLQYPPQVHQFSSVEAWLIAWVGFRLSKAKGTHSEYEINGKTCLGLIGSIGLDSAIGEDGTFYIISGFEEEASWQKATFQEQLWLTVCVQRQLYPEFSVLLPLRPKDALDCANCGGTGFVYGNFVICSTCSALGWLVPAET